MKMNNDRWLLRKGGYDDCGITSVGGAAFELAAEKEPDAEVDWERFPVREMVKRGWIACENSISELFDAVPEWERLCPLYHQMRIRSNKQVDPYSLAAWTARIVLKSRDQSLRGRFNLDSIDLSLMRDLAKLSDSETGPQDAIGRLAELGIAVVVEPHLPRTHLDGAALWAGGDTAIIGLTIRYDRIDNFWYCLMHELAHLALHAGDERDLHFFDDLDTSEEIDPREVEADELAFEALIPKGAWDASPAKLLPSKEAAELLAKELKIHPAIVAGRMRSERSYMLLSQLVGSGGIRCQFPNIEWR